MLIKSFFQHRKNWHVRAVGGGGGGKCRINKYLYKYKNKVCRVSDFYQLPIVSKMFYSISWNTVKIN